MFNKPNVVRYHTSPLYSIACTAAMFGLAASLPACPSQHEHAHPYVGALQRGEPATAHRGVCQIAKYPTTVTQYLNQSTLLRCGVGSMPNTQCNSTGTPGAERPLKDSEHNKHAVPEAQDMQEELSLLQERFSSRCA